LYPDPQRLREHSADEEDEIVMIAMRAHRGAPMFATFGCARLIGSDGTQATSAPAATNDSNSRPTPDR